MTPSNQGSSMNASGTSPNVLTVGQTRAVVAGATGLVGGYAVRYALKQATVGTVTTVGRKNLGISHPKLREVLHRDFTDCSPLAQALSDQDAAVFCLGAYTGAVPDAEFRTITVDYTKEFARVTRRPTLGEIAARVQAAVDRDEICAVPGTRAESVVQRMLDAD